MAEKSTINDQIVAFLKDREFKTCTSDFAKYVITENGHRVEVAYHIGTGDEIFSLGANSGKVTKYCDFENSFTVTGLDGFKVVYSVSSMAPEGEAFPLDSLQSCVKEAMEKLGISK